MNYPPTKKQESLAKNIVLDRYENLKSLLVASGYSEATAMGKPGEILAQKGVQEVLERVGFNPTAAKARLSEILLTGTNSEAMQVAQEIFKVFGEYAPVKSASLNVNVNAKEEYDDPELYPVLDKNNDR